MLLLVFSHLGIVLFAEILVDRHENLANIIDSSFVTDTCFSEDKEIERCIDPLATVDAIDVGL